MSDPLADPYGGALPITTPDLPVYQDRFLSDYTAPARDVLGAQIGQAVDELPIAQAGDISGLQTAEQGRLISRFGGRDAPDSPLLSPDDAKAKLEAGGLQGQLEIPDGGIRSRALDLLMAHRTEQNRRNSIVARSPGGFGLTAAGVTGQLATSVLDPLNDAMAFIPVVGEARYAKLLASAGESLVGRAAVRAGVGAVEGATGAAVLQPLQYEASQAYQDDYTMNDAAANVLFGGLFGAALHSVGGGIGDVYRMGRGVPLEHQKAAASEAIAALIEDRQPRVSELMEGIRRQDLLGSTSTAALSPETQFRFDTPAEPRPAEIDNLQPLSPEEAQARRVGDVEARAREIDPQTFAEHDRLQTERETYRRWIDELGGTRSQTAEAGATDLDQQIARTKEQLADANARKTKIYQKRLDDLQAQRDAHVTAATKADTPDMATVRQKLQQADFKLRDLAEKVSDAKRQAEQDVPAVGAERAPASDTAQAAPPFDADAALAGALQPHSLMDTLTQIRDDRVNLRPDDASLVAEVTRQTPNFNKAPTPEATESELTSYAAATDDAVNTMALSGRLGDADRAILAEADQQIVQAEQAGQGWKAAASCIARAFT